MAKYYINFRCAYSNTVETIEAVNSKPHILELWEDYKLIGGYYISKRATKDYYAIQKKNIINLKQA